MTELDPKLLDHNYDGIQELDNDLPRWWIWLFYITIVWAVLYMGFYHVFNIGYLSADEYRRELDPNYERIQSVDAKMLGIIPNYHSPLYDPPRDARLAGTVKKAGGITWHEESRETDTITYVALTDPAAIEAGKGIFTIRCVQCHGKSGEGNIGPNLTDDYWLHGAGMTNVVKTIKYGYPAKGMLAWRTELTPDQIQQVASYVLSVHGSNPPNPKPPQGDLVKQ
ncbi:MAG: cbb3-type cytochrome c oxidase N-terminal domain-containing protein [Candidatus Zixiibacteriota bacterium]